jgi:hypothetical protein
MSAEKPLSLPDRFKLAHHSLPHPSRLVRLLSPIIFILLSTGDRLGYELSMGDSVTTMLIGTNLTGFTSITAQ